MAWSLFRVSISGNTAPVNNKKLANTKARLSGDLMLGQYRKRLTNIPATLIQILLAGNLQA